MEGQHRKGGFWPDIGQKIEPVRTYGIDSYTEIRPYPHKLLSIAKVIHAID